MFRHFKETSMSVFKQNNTIDVLLVHYLDSFNSDNLFRDFNTNKMEIDSIIKYSLLNKATTVVKPKTIGLKSKKEQL